ncbi:MAG: hypothetical protein DWB45_14045 [Xanthomonadales bacterium]|nr:hypothetical protein [Xanthomonadales bacterium]
MVSRSLIARSVVAMAIGRIVGVRGRGGNAARVRAARCGHNRPIGSTRGQGIGMSLSDNELRGGAAIQQLHWLAAGQVDSAGLLRAYEAAIARDNGRLNAFLALADDAAQQAAASDARRRANTIGRLDGLVVAVKDNLDVAGLPTTAGLPARRARVAAADASAVARLRAAGAVMPGGLANTISAIGAPFLWSPQSSRDARRPSRSGTPNPPGNRTAGASGAR